MSAAALFDPITDFFVWDKVAILHGQLWRILLGNFAHNNLEHFMINILSLWLLGWLFRPTGATYLVTTLIFSTAIGAVLLKTTTVQYVGLSGSLHSLFAYFSFQEIVSGKKGGGLLLISLAVKLGVGENIGVNDQALIPIATMAHSAGVFVGLAGSITYLAIEKGRFFFGISTRRIQSHKKALPPYRMVQKIFHHLSK